MKISTERLKQIIKEELNEDLPDWARRTLARKADRERENTKPRQAMNLLSQLRSYTTEEWSPKAAASFDALLDLLKEMEEDLNINP